MEDVYATARGPLARVASPLAARARARRHRRLGAPRGQGLVRADARVLVSDRAALAASRRALAPGALAPALLAPGRGRRVAGDLAAATGRAGASVRPRASRAVRTAGQE